MHKDSWLVITIVAFVGGIVANIVRPSRRGIVGFASAGLVAAFAGFTAGMLFGVFGYVTEVQIVVAAVVGILGDRIITWLLHTKFFGDKTIIVNKGGTNVQGDVVGGDKAERDINHEQQNTN